MPGHPPPEEVEKVMNESGWSYLKALQYLLIETGNPDGYDSLTDDEIRRLDSTAAPGKRSAMTGPTRAGRSSSTKCHPATSSGR